jgi:hypothetical protein
MSLDLRAKMRIARAIGTRKTDNRTTRQQSLIRHELDASGGCRTMTLGAGTSIEERSKPVVGFC